MTWIQAHFLGDPIIAFAIIVYIGLLFSIGLWAVAVRRSHHADHGHDASGTALCGTVIVGTDMARVEDRLAAHEMHCNGCFQVMAQDNPERTPSSDQ